MLDAPCGTGKYFPLVAAAGHQVVGADQSAGMLAQARVRGIASRLDHVALQEGLVFLDEGFRREDGWGYRHFLLRVGQ